MTSRAGPFESFHQHQRFRETSHFLAGKELSPTHVTSSAFPRFSCLRMTKSEQRTRSLQVPAGRNKMFRAFQGLGFHLQVHSPEPSTQDSSPGPTPFSTLLAQGAAPSAGSAGPATPLGSASVSLGLECCSLPSPPGRSQPLL